MLIESLAVQSILLTNCSPYSSGIPSPPIESKKRLNKTHGYALLLNLWQSSRFLNDLRISSILFILTSLVN